MNKLLLTAALALLTLVSANADFALQPPPKASASAAVTSPQLGAQLTAIGAGLQNKTTADVQSLGVVAFNNQKLANLAFKAVAGKTVSVRIILTDEQFAAFIAAGPALPSGKTAADVLSYNETAGLGSGGGITAYVVFK